GVARLADPRRLGRPDRERHGAAERHYPDRHPARMDGELRGHGRRRGLDAPRGDRGAAARFVVAHLRAACVRAGPARHRPRGRGAADLRYMRVPAAVLARPRPCAHLRVSALSGRAVLVTGAARGIGAAVAEAVVEADGVVALLDVNPAGKEVAARLAERGKAHFFRCDVRMPEEVDRAVTDAIGALGGLDGLVNNAGVNAYFDAVEMDEDDWDSV